MEKPQKCDKTGEKKEQFLFLEQGSKRTGKRFVLQTKKEKDQKAY